MNKKRLIIITVFFLFVLNTVYGISKSKMNTENDFEIKGFHLDLRIQVMKLDALKDFADELASFGINTLIMEWEATFPFESHPIIPNKYAYTKEEIQEFIAYCTELKIDVIPLQQCLGHLEYILRHDRYAAQRESQKDVSQICPLKEELNRALFTDLFTEMTELHTSKYFHIGGDEAYLLGNCDACSKKVEAEGKSKLLADHLKMVCDIVVSLGKIPVLWADVANKYPEELWKLPKETIFMVWNYGWRTDLFGDPKKLTEMGFNVWGAPSLRCSPDNYYLTKWEDHFNNIRDFIPVCRNSGYSGVVMTSWSTSGAYSSILEDKHTITDLIPIRNVYPISGFRILLAAYAKSLKSTEPLNIEHFIIGYCKDRFGFNKNEALLFWKAIQGKPFEIINGKVRNQNTLNVKMLLDSARQDQIILNNLAPIRNSKEFEHFRLMTDIRENYLAFKHVETIVNSQIFSDSITSEVLDQLETIIEKDNAIKIRFTELNSDILYSGQIEEENRTRIKRVELLYDRLKKIR